MRVCLGFDCQVFIADVTEGKVKFGLQHPCSAGGILSLSFGLFLDENAVKIYGPVEFEN